MINFIDRALTKGQMNSVRAGACADATKYVCVATLTDNSKVEYTVAADSAIDAAVQIHDETGAKQVNCTKYHEKEASV